jgi:hypothetical protein
MVMYSNNRLAYKQLVDILDGVGSIHPDKWVSETTEEEYGRLSLSVGVEKYEAVLDGIWRKSALKTLKRKEWQYNPKPDGRYGVWDLNTFVVVPPGVREELELSRSIQHPGTPKPVFTTDCRVQQAVRMQEASDCDFTSAAQAVETHDEHHRDATGGRDR